MMWNVDLRLTASYDATPEEVFAMITDTTFQEQVFERIRSQSYDVVVRDTGDDTVVRVWWETRSVDVPAVAKRFVGQPLVVAQTKIWHPADREGARDGEGEVADAPINAHGPNADLVRWATDEAAVRSACHRHGAGGR